MALTRKMLTAMDIPAEKIDEIINAHVETVDALKEERDGFKADAEELPKVKKKLEEVKKELADADANDWEQKYNDLKKEYDDYKTDIVNKTTRSAKEKAYKQILIDAGIPEKRIPTIIKVSGSEIDKLELDDNGKAKNVEKVTEDIKSEWSDFIVKSKEKGVDTPNPPANNNGSGTLTKEEIMKIKDPAKRQEAWAKFLSKGDE